MIRQVDRSGGGRPQSRGRHMQSSSRRKMAPFDEDDDSSSNLEEAVGEAVGTILAGYHSPSGSRPTSRGKQRRSGVGPFSSFSARRELDRSATGTKTGTSRRATSGPRPRHRISVQRQDDSTCGDEDQTIAANSMAATVDDDDSDDDLSAETPLAARARRIVSCHAEETDRSEAGFTTTESSSEDEESRRPRRKRSASSGNYRPVPQLRTTRASRPSISRGRDMDAASRRPERSHRSNRDSKGNHHRDRDRGATGKGSRRKAGSSSRRTADPLVTPEMLASGIQTVSTSLRTGICSTYSLLQEGSAAAAAGAAALQHNLAEVGQKLPNSDDVADNVVGALDRAETMLSWDQDHQQAAAAAEGDESPGNDDGGVDNHQLRDESMFGGTTYSSIDPASFSLDGEGIADNHRSVLNTSSDTTPLNMQHTLFGGAKGGYPAHPSLEQQKKELEAATASKSGADESEYDKDEGGLPENSILSDASDDVGGHADDSLSATGKEENGNISDTVEKSELVSEHIRTIQSLRLQIETLQQTSVLAQRGWDDARSTLDKERAESSRLQMELENHRDENARLRERNSELEKTKEEQAQIAQKLNDDNEIMAKELIEAISQLENLKHAASVPEQKTALATDESTEQKDTSFQTTLAYSLPSDEGKASETEANVAPAPPPPASLPPQSPGRSFSSASTPTATPSESSEQTKARIRAERQARIFNRPKSRGRAGMSAGIVSNQRPSNKSKDTSKLPSRVEQAVVDWTKQEKRSIAKTKPEEEEDWTDPDLDPFLFGMESTMADPLDPPMDPPSSGQRNQTPPRQKMVEKGAITPDTVAVTPSPESSRRGRLGDEGNPKPWSAIRSAPLHIVQPPRLFPKDLAKSNDSHAVMTYVGPRLSEPDSSDLTAAEFDAAYLTLDDANFRARYAFFVLNAMGKEVEELLDDPSVVVGTTDGKLGGNSAWGDRLQLSYKYKDWAGQKMVWKVWVIPAGGFVSSPPRTPPRNGDSTTKKTTSDGKLRMLV